MVGRRLPCAGGSRFKSFPIQDDAPTFVACRDVERNALRSGLVAAAEDWRRGSLNRRLRGDPGRLLSDGPLPLPHDWVARVNQPETAGELTAIRRCAARGMPLGSPEWSLRIAREWGLGPTMREAGRRRSPRPLP